MKRRRQGRTPSAPGRGRTRSAKIARATNAASARRRSKGASPLAPSGSLAEVLKFQKKSTAALRAVKMPMAVEPSFVFKP
jgi:hypothetical protein